jgi:hypothetical protein
MNANVADTKFSFKIAFLASLPLILMACAITLSRIANGVFIGIDEDPDSNTRLAQVRDFLAGQDWFDLTMNRFGLDRGMEMHWSRLGDLGPAALLWFFSLFLGPEQSETATSITYPLLLVIPLSIAMMWTTSRLAPHLSTIKISLATAVILVQMEVLWTHFVPGNIDHHNLQIIALIVFLGGCCGQRTLKSGVIAAFGLMAGVLIGLDSMPAFVAILGVLGCLWLFNPNEEARFLTGLGSGILVVSLVGAVFFLPRPISMTYCDSWTPPMGLVMAGLGTVLLVAAAIGTRVNNVFARAGIVGAIGIAILAALMIQFPSCLNQMPPDNVLADKYWWPLIPETRSVVFVFQAQPKLLGMFAPAFVAIIAYVIALRQNWLTFKASAPVVGAVIVSFIVACLYMRVGATMAAVIVPLTAVVLAQALHAAQNLRGRLLSWVLLAPTLSVFCLGTIFGTFAPKSEGPELVFKAEDSYYCVAHSDLPAIRALPHGTIISPFALTEYLLRHTKLQVAFGGYHRAYGENIEIMTWLTGRADPAKAALTQHKVRYLAVCPTNAQYIYMAADNPQSLVADLIAKRPPSWLVPVVPLRDGGMIYEVKVPQ